MPLSPDIKKKTDLKKLKKFINDHPNKKLVLTGGVFDFLKPGHIDLFDFSREREGVLVVAVGTTGNYTPLEERLEILDAVDGIDFLFTYSDLSDLNITGDLFNEIIFNEEFEFPRDKISPNVKVTKFPV